MSCANISAYKYQTIVFDVPSEEYYDAVRCFFDKSPWEVLDQKSIDFFSNEELLIERRHFIKQEKKIYPLFNPSLLLDVYISLLEHAPISIVKKHIRQTFINTISKVYMGKNSKDLIVSNLKLCEGKKICSPRFPGFLLALRDKIIFFIDTSDIGLENAIMLIEQVELLHKTNNLGIVDLNSNVGMNMFSGISIPKEQDIDYILFDEYTNLSKCHLAVGTRDRRVVYTAIDLMYMLLFADSIEQILQFSDFLKKSEEKIFTFGGMADYFTFWKEEAGCIAKGAIEFGMIYAEYETAASYIYDIYVCLKECFPFHINSLPIGTPEEWNIIQDDNGVFQCIKKTDEMLGGALFQLRNKCVFFVSYDYRKILLHERIQEVQQYRDFIGGIIERFLIQYGKILSEINYLSGKFICLHCESLTTSLQKEKYVEITDEKIISQEICIKYVVDSVNVMKDITKCVDRSVENKLILELFSSLVERETIGFGTFLTELKKNTSLKKTANAHTEKLDYYYNTNSLKLHIGEKAEVLVRKEIAKLAFDNGVMPGQYMQKEATEVIRKMQNSLVEYFEHMLLKYERINLHIVLLKLYSSELFLDYSNLEGYSLSNEIEDLQKENSKQKLFHLRERNKGFQDALVYLIETNLYLDTERGTENINNFELEKAIAFAKWLVILQNNSDLCYHTDSKTKLIILNDYQVNVELGKEYSNKHDFVRRRMYESTRYAIKGSEEDHDFIEKIFEGFKSDTGVEFRVLEAVMKQLYECSFPNETVRFREAYPNVIVINKEDAIKDYEAFVIRQTETEMVQKAYEFLTIDSRELKRLDGKDHPILPIWDRKQRKNRFVLRPLLLIGDEYIYSPITIWELHERWYYGLLQFYPPYESGLNTMLSHLWAWKEHYEHLFAFDVREMFRLYNLSYAESNVDIRRVDRKGKHPPIHELGDYDVIALDMQKQRIYLIECKFLQPIGSVFEHSKEQERFFLKEKFDEKFQKRIDYFTKVYKSFFKNIGFDLSNTEYEVKPYMVVNKVFESYFKKVNFPIVTMDELRKAIQEI